MSLTAQVERMLAQAKQIDAHLAAKNLPPPTFDQDSLADLPAELQDVKATLANEANEFKMLMRGPVMAAMDLAFSWTDVLPLYVIYRYEIAQAVPLEGTASYAEIAQATALQEDTVRRIVRAAIGNHILDEDPGTERVRHTAISRLLHSSQGFRDAIGLQIDDLRFSGSKVVEAWKKWGDTASEPNQTAFSLANNTELSCFQTLGKEPWRGKRLGGAMHFYTQDDAWNLRHLAAAFDWASIDQPGTQMLDVGGGMGQISQFLAQHTKNLHFVVEDLPHVVPAATSALPPALRDRVSFVVHDFLEPRAGGGRPTDAVLMRWVLHNWHETYCVQILQGLIPVMRPGTKLLIFEYVLDEAPVRDLNGRFGLQLDLLMLANYNGRVRTTAQFERVLAAADKRFVVTGVHRPLGSTMSLIEVTWTPSS